MRLLVFTCRRDAGKAALATRTVPADWSVGWVLDGPDADLPVPAGVEKMVVPFQRGANLSTPQACWWISQLLAREAEAHGRAGKMDSDCLLIEPSFLLKGDLAGMAHAAGMGAVYGLAYAMTRKAARRAAEGVKQAIQTGAIPSAEDVGITSRAKAGGGVLPHGAFWDSPHNGSLPPKGVVAVHCGSTAYAPRDGDRVAREMARLGQALGLWRRG